MESSRPSRLASCYRITVYVVECESPHDSSQTMQQATNDVSQMGTEELVEDDLQVGGSQAIGQRCALARRGPSPHPS